MGADHVLSARRGAVSDAPGVLVPVRPHLWSVPAEPITFWQTFVGKELRCCLTEAERNEEA